MPTLSKVKTVARAVSLAFALGATSFSANAVLERVGPASTAPDIGGYPTWYQDTTGLALEFCAPQTVAEVEGGWCLLLPPDVPQVPEAFPDRFFDEHFYFAAGANLTTRQQGSKAYVVLAEEGAFATGAPAAGQQITFARIRLALNPVPVSGNYRFIHPYGEDTFNVTAGERIFYTEDVGLGAPGDFAGSLNGRLGPFLLASTTPGGPEMPPVTADNPAPDADPAHFGGGAPTPYPGTGKAYIADPARLGPVTGSPLPNFVDSTGASRNHNIFRIEGPPGSGLGVDPNTGAVVDWIETTDFTLMGRVMAGTIPGRIAIQRASYARNNIGQKLEVFATAAETAQGRLPAQLKPPTAAPQLTFFDAPCVGTVDARGTVHPPFSQPIGAVETQMFSTDGLHWGQMQPAQIPTQVCVKDGSARDVNGNLVPSYAMQTVVDEVVVGGAYFDAAAGTLTVTAVSSDQVAKPKLTLAYGTFRGDLDSTGQIVVPGLIAAPANVAVQSAALGSANYDVSTSFLGGTPSPAGIPVAANDTFTFLEDSGLQVLDVLGNDTNAAGGTITITGAPRLGSAVLSNGKVNYTPNLNANGADAFTYTATSNGKISNTATVTLNITPVNDAPTAVNDTVNAIRNLPRQFNVLANDTDPDGAADLADAVLVTPPPASASATVTGGTGGIFTITGANATTFTFTYLAVDRSGTQSGNTATVTVQVAAAENLTFSRADYTRTSSRLRVVGSVQPAMQQTVTLAFINSAGTVVGNIGTTTADAAGAWTFDQTIALPSGAVSVRATSNNNTVRAQALSIK